MTEEQNQTQDLAPVKPEIKPGELIVRDDGEYSMLMDTAKFNQAWRVAKMFSESKMVPAHFQGSTASVFVALHLAMRMQLDPMMVMQNTYMISGRPGMEAKMIIGLVNSRGPFKGPIQWEFEGEGKNRKCTAYAIHKITGERCEVTVDWEMVEKEGWAGKQGSKWQTIPDMMFRYRSAAFLARLYCPEVILGLYTVDELEDMGNGVIDAETVPAPALVEVEKKSQGDKIKDELKTRKKRSDAGQSRGEKGKETEPEPEQEQKEDISFPEGVKPIAPEHLAKIKEMAKTKDIDPAMICQDQEVNSLDALTYDQGLVVMEWLKNLKN